MLKGHLDMIVLAALAGGPAHGYAVIQEIRRRSGGAFDLPEGTIYPALHRLERQKWISADWKLSENKQRVRVYRLTATGKKQLLSERSRWEQLSDAIAGVLSPAKREGQA